MTDPIVIATNVRRGRECWILKITCPHCGKTHTHGGGDGPAPHGGHYVAHCLSLPRRGYFIDLGDQKAKVRHG